MSTRSAVLDAIASHARSRPRAVALRDDDGEIDYATLWQQVEALSAWLGEHTRGCVALEGENSSAWVIADLAAWHARIPLVPIPNFFAPAQREHVLRSAQVRDVLRCGPRTTARTDASLHPTSAAAVRHLVREPTAPDATAGMAEDLRKITFTSGTTGTPKGVCISATMLERVCRDLAARMHASPQLGEHLRRHFALLPLGTLLENVAGVHVPLMLGREVVVRSGASIGLLGSSRLDPVQLLQALHRDRPDSLILLPQILRALVTAAERGHSPPDSLRFVAVGGAPSGAGLIARARALGIPVFEGYGLSECASVVALNAPGMDRVGSVGRVLDGLRVRIVDGGIQVAGSAFPGYLGQPRAPDAEWLDTGDVGHLDPDGFLYVTGRRKHVMISSYGRNISPEWLEAELVAADSIAQAMALGDGRPNCAALVVPARGADRESISRDIARINAALPDYARIEGFALASEPFSVENGCLTDNGRLRRDVIAARHADEIAAAFEPPRTPSRSEPAHELL